MVRPCHTHSNAPLVTVVQQNNGHRLWSVGGSKEAIHDIRKSTTKKLDAECRGAREVLIAGAVTRCLHRRKVATRGRRQVRAPAAYVIHPAKSRKYLRATGPGYAAIAARFSSWTSAQLAVEYFFISCSEEAIELSNAGKIDVSAKERRAFKRSLNCVLSYVFDWDK
jgi:hypothetical protein